MAPSTFGGQDFLFLNCQDFYLKYYDPFYYAILFSSPGWKTVGWRLRL